MALYAAYGTNLDPAQMLKRAPHSPLHCTGWLRGWRLTFGGANASWNGPLPTIVEDRDSAVYVALYDLTDADGATLDEWEGLELELYSKISVMVDALEGRFPSWCYVLNDYEGGLPSARTLGMLADAAEAAGAPQDYVHELRLRPCLSG